MEPITDACCFGGQDSLAVASLFSDDVPTTLTTVLDGRNRSTGRQDGQHGDWDIPSNGSSDRAGTIEKTLPPVLAVRVDIRHTHIYGSVEDRCQDSDVILGAFWRYILQDLFHEQSCLALRPPPSFSSAGSGPDRGPAIRGGRRVVRQRHCRCGAGMTKRTPREIEGSSAENS